MTDNKLMATANDDWDVINTYFRDTPHFLTLHHLSSFHEFVFQKIPYTIRTLNPFKTLKYDDAGTLKHEINVYVGGRDGDAIYISKPTIVEKSKQRALFPNEARLKDKTYASDIFCDIIVEYIDHLSGKHKDVEFKRIKIGAIPIMLHSRLCALYDQSEPVLKEMGECPYDQGGYFIVDGKEKVVLAQERIATNRIFVMESNDANYTHEALIRCTPEENNLFPKTIRFAVHGRDMKNLRGQITYRRNEIVLTSPNVKGVIPLWMMFRALGVESDRDILEHILGEVDDAAKKPMLDFLRASLIECRSAKDAMNNLYDEETMATVYTQAEALEWFAKRVEYQNVDSARNVIANDFLPNMGFSYRNKALFLGHVVNKIVKTALGVIQPTDRDNYMFKRIDLSGLLLANLFRDLYNRFRNNVRNMVDQQYVYGPWKSTGNIEQLVNKDNMRTIFNEYIIQTGFIKSLKGNWGGDGDPSKAGIVQDLNRLSYLGYISHVRRLSTPLDSSSKIVGPRKLNTSHWGYICPIESPDGGNIGLIKHLSMLTNVTSDVNGKEVLRCLQDNGLVSLQQLQPVDVSRVCKVFLNDIWVGTHKDPHVFVNRLRQLRRAGLIAVTIGLSWNIYENEVHVRCDAGRCTRPLYVVRDGKTSYSDGKWLQLVRGTLLGESVEMESAYRSDIIADVDNDVIQKHKNAVEYIDVEESNTCLIAMNRVDLDDTLKAYTHCEIHPSTSMSVYTNTIPLAHLNPGTRNVFSGAQGKQAIGVFATNFNQRIDTASYLLHYPQKALVSTKYAQTCNMDELPNGENLIVAILCYSGYNMEDSVMINKNSIERGMFNVSVFKSFVDEESTNQNAGEKIVFVNPNELKKQGHDIDIKGGNWDKIDAHGFPKVNSYISDGDVFVGRCNVTTQMQKRKEAGQIFKETVRVDTYADKSKKGSKTVYGTIDKVFVHSNQDDERTLKVRFRKVRSPTLGDKMASRHGQKGVVGAIVPQEDMPFTKDGLVPDIIINPHAFPTRMTIAHLVECILAKLCCVNGVRVDGTMFDTPDTEALYDMLEKNGMNRHGDEMMYNGRTGEQIPTHVFIGPTYYFRLKHMVSDKVNSRAGGAVSTMTHQPIKGRAKGGGLRIGEMETNCLIAYGMGSFIKESMMERSDKSEFVLDKALGTVAVENKQDGSYTNQYGEPVQETARVRAPYSWKLLLQEIDAFGMTTRLITEDEVLGDDGSEDDDYMANALDDELNSDDEA